MAYYNSEVIEQVRQLDVYSYLLNYEPDELVKVSRDTYCTKSHDSLKISNGMWYWFSRGIGGKSAIDYLIAVKDFSFIQAVETILNYMKKVPIKTCGVIKKKEESSKLILPERNQNNDKVIRYLIDRGIDKDIILECIDKGYIYEDQKHNVIFIGYDYQNNPRYAMCRATNSSRFMNDVYGSHKAFSFRLNSLEPNCSVHLFESAIDLLSYATLLKLNHREWYNYNLLSLAGVYQPSAKMEDSKIPLALNYFLNQNPNIKKIYLHLDNDQAGRTASLTLKTVLPKCYEIIDNPVPVGKDVNDFLCRKIDKMNHKEKER